MERQGARPRPEEFACDIQRNEILAGVSVNLPSARLVSMLRSASSFGREHELGARGIGGRLIMQSNTTIATSLDRIPPRSIQAPSGNACPARSQSMNDHSPVVGPTMDQTAPSAAAFQVEAGINGENQ